MTKLHPLMVAQLLAVRAACEATIWGVNALLEASQPADDSPQPNGGPQNENRSQNQSQPPEMAEPGQPEGPEQCPHPVEQRRSAPVMGNPNRQMCGLCRQEVK